MSNKDNLEFSTIVDMKSRHYNDLMNLLNILRDAIKKYNLVLYGGIAIHYGLLLKGHPGIYDEFQIPDYDVFSNNSYTDSNNIASDMHQLGYSGISSISALHVVTRKVRYNFWALCDISNIEMPLSDIPTLEYNGIKFIHPNFQRLHLYLVLSEPFARELSENIFYRLDKDIKRLHLINEYYPILVNVPNTLNYIPYPVNIDSSKHIGGLLAYSFYYMNSSSNTDLIKIEYDGTQLTLPDKIPHKYITYYDYFKEYKLNNKYEIRYRFHDFLPKSLLIKEKSLEIMNLKYSIICVNKIKYKNTEYSIMNIYNLLVYFLSYYFLTKNDIYIMLVHSLETMIKINNGNDIYQISFNYCGDLMHNRTTAERYMSKKNFQSMPQYIPDQGPPVEFDINKYIPVIENIHCI